ncbi:hypothetical protein DI09_28p80 [Mitosporidium daphniae]|uniref:Cofilin n=1 Tax=Mitosporidium daphniae TaxID=1485682 RepID=A0A098VRT5_9MICR|nr:uncharacterized protein DI09_28p80 [Mitosporidium daphniae]KGG51727.1 hypothetical protein DI09_28p80 [Mitosporidium daphniae]|eukprot:XP_013238179.1 uncharacterized protein DI09_28p80 [Mitosporidium daphniae]
MSPIGGFGFQFLSKMSSGINVDDSCLVAFDELKKNSKHTYLQFKISEKRTKIVVEELVKPAATFEEFVANLPEDDGRYAVYDLEYKLSDTDGLRKKILFISWIPDSAVTGQKMTYACSKDALKSKLLGIALDIQANCKEDLEYSSIMDRLRNKN